MDKLDIEDMGAAAVAKQRDQSPTRTSSNGGGLEIGFESSSGQRPTVVEKPVKLKGFIAYDRAVVGYRPAKVRVEDWREIGMPRDEVCKYSVVHDISSFPVGSRAQSRQ